MDLLGWVVKTGMWTGDPFNAWSSATKGLLPGYASALVTYVALTAALACGVKLLGGNVARFVGTFTVVFFIAFICTP